MTTTMRPSRVLKKLRAGGVAHCTKLNLADARAAEIAALCGIDSVWLDLEHVANTLQDIENQIRAAKIYGCDAIVRVKRGSYSDFICPLELDATGLMVPHVMSGEDARNIVWQTRFQPLGRRPLDGGNADGLYCGIATADYIAQANRERFIIAQIEDPEAMDDLDAIAGTAGIDMLFFGPGDFSHAIGLAGQINHPDVAGARRKMAETAQAHGKFAGTVAPLTELPDYVEMGYRFLSCGADVVSLRNTFTQIVETFHQLEG